MSMSWQKQSLTEPLFPQIVWNQPVNRKNAKSLLIIGGHSNGMQTVQTAYENALDAGIGHLQILVPQSLHSILGNREDINYVAATRSGSIAQTALDDLLKFSRAADGILIPGDTSNNPETISTLHRLLDMCDLPTIINDEAIQSLASEIKTINCATALVGTVRTYSKLAKMLDIPIQVYRPNLAKEVQLLQSLQQKLSAVTALASNTTLVASGHDVTSTNFTAPDTTQLAAWVATFILQHQNPYPAAVTALWQLGQQLKTQS